MIKKKKKALRKVKEQGHRILRKIGYEETLVLRQIFLPLREVPSLRGVFVVRFL